MGTYDRQVSTAQRLIAKKGQSVTWHQQSNGAPADANKPWKPGSAAPVGKTVSIVFFPYSQLNRELIRAMTGTEVPTGQMQGLMGAVDFEPSIKDTVVRNGKVLTIASIDPLAPNGEIILYTIGFKQ